MGREMQRDNVGLDVNQSWCSNVLVCSGVESLLKLQAGGSRWLSP